MTTIVSCLISGTNRRWYDHDFQTRSVKFSPYTALYDLIIPKDNMPLQINDLVDFSFILDELKSKYRLDNGRNGARLVKANRMLVTQALRSRCGDLSLSSLKQSVGTRG